jgi:hypothetical protein
MKPLCVFLAAVALWSAPAFSKRLSVRASGLIETIKDYNGFWIMQVAGDDHEFYGCLIEEPDNRIYLMSKGDRVSVEGTADDKDKTTLKRCHINLWEKK